MIAIIIMMVMTMIALMLVIIITTIGPCVTTLIFITAAPQRQHIDSFIKVSERESCHLYNAVTPSTTVPS